MVFVLCVLPGPRITASTNVQVHVDGDQTVLAPDSEMLYDRPLQKFP